MDVQGIAHSDVPTEFIPRLFLWCPIHLPHLSELVIPFFAHHTTDSNIVSKMHLLFLPIDRVTLPKAPQVRMYCEWSNNYSSAR